MALSRVVALGMILLGVGLAGCAAQGGKQAPPAASVPTVPPPQNRQEPEVSAPADASVGLLYGNRAPEFALPDLKGRTVRLSDFRGKVVFVNFWATWCPPCRAEMPDIQAVKREHAGEVQVLAINVGEDEATVTSFLKTLKLDLPVLLDRSLDVALGYRAIGLPTSYFIDREGRIAARWVGMMDRQGMEQALREAGAHGTGKP